MNGHKYVGAYTSVSLDLLNCGGPLKDAEEADRQIRELIRKSGMTVRKSIVDPFVDEAQLDDGGSYMVVYTCMAYTLNESGVYITMLSTETWPEVRMVKIVIDLCHFSRNNREAAVELANGFEKLFAPEEGKIVVARRTIEDMEGARM